MSLDTKIPGSGTNLVPDPCTEKEIVARNLVEMIEILGEILMQYFMEQGKNQKHK